MLLTAHPPQALPSFTAVKTDISGKYHVYKKVVLQSLKAYFKSQKFYLRASANVDGEQRNGHAKVSKNTKL